MAAPNTEGTTIFILLGSAYGRLMAAIVRGSYQTITLYVPQCPPVSLPLILSVPV
ncbi:hypothetical protein K503DRAFT_133826 [Rhizopogon vinicolor AM-OR11-026]|uniref:Uncharacterized protein n=1 Tax=Rhizopogon vinicolor AM-OR11-026 TaxID=1314800 RepID=A0A1B7MEI7_9AGAM|nr:hypothetical protein K503DRAFT_133826 [Rhizopogon vinicolor AM-OR11-026]